MMLSVRLTAHELTIVKDEAARREQSVSEYVRECILSPARDTNPLVVVDV
jgi:hypothetical protein